MNRIFLRFVEPLLVIALLAALVLGARGWRWAAGCPPIDEYLMVAVATEDDGRMFDDALAAGASPRYHDALGGTALMAVAGRGNVGQLRRLLALGAEVNATDHWGESALFWAARLDHAEAVQFLLVHGADPSLRDRLGSTALDIAVRREAHAAEAVLRRHATHDDPRRP